MEWIYIAGEDKYIVDFILPIMTAEVYADSYEEAEQIAAEALGISDNPLNNHFMAVITCLEEDIDELDEDVDWEEY